jgi:hypothetical protein
LKGDIERAKKKRAEILRKLGIIATLVIAVGKSEKM